MQQQNNQSSFAWHTAAPKPKKFTLDSPSRSMELDISPALRQIDKPAPAGRPDDRKYRQIIRTKNQGAKLELFVRIRSGSENLSHQISVPRHWTLLDLKFYLQQLTGLPISAESVKFSIGGKILKNPN